MVLLLLLVHSPLRSNSIMSRKGILSLEQQQTHSCVPALTTDRTVESTRVPPYSSLEAAAGELLVLVCSTVLWPLAVDLLVNVSVLYKLRQANTKKKIPRLPACQRSVE